jgi:hypothetical protein
MSAMSGVALRTAVACGLLTLSAHAIPFEFSYIYGSDDANGVITGSFEGTHKHGYVYDITNVQIFYNGVAMPTLDGQYYITNVTGTGAPIVSFEGWRNDFRISDTNDTTTFRTGNKENSFFFFSGGHARFFTPEVGEWEDVETEEGTRRLGIPTRWSLTSPEIKPDITRVPDGGHTLALLGIAMAAFGVVRRQMALSPHARPAAASWRSHT